MGLILDTYDDRYYFVVTTENILEPLGLLVLGDSRFSLMPQTREMTARIVGMDGEYDFGCEFEMRVLELHCATQDGLSVQQKFQLQRTLARWLNPKNGFKYLVFMDNPDYLYEVKYSGITDVTEHPTWFEVTLPFKAKPFIVSAVEYTKPQGTFTYNGTVEAPVSVVITGPATNPTLTWNGETISLTVDIPDGGTYTIDSTVGRAFLNGADVTNSYPETYYFPQAALGENTFSVSAGTAVAVYRERYL